MKKGAALITVVLGIMFCITSLVFGDDPEIRLIVRGDDLGMSQSSLIAFEQALNEGILTSASIQTCAPWFEGAAELCVKNPGWCIGIHLCLVGEWRGYRWRPVLPWDQVSSIVDEDGYLYTSPDELNAHNPNIDDVEKEMRAQIDLAIKRGIVIQYLDNHYGAVESVPGGRELLLQLSKDYNVPISGFNNEKRVSIYTTDIDQKLEHAVEQLSNLEPGLYCWVCHPGIDSPEQYALIHTQPDHIFTNGGVGPHRAEVLNVLTSIEVKSMILAKGIKLTDYRELKDELLKK